MNKFLNCGLASYNRFTLRLAKGQGVSGIVQLNLQQSPNDFIRKQQNIVNQIRALIKNCLHAIHIGLYSMGSF